MIKLLKEKWEKREQSAKVKGEKDVGSSSTITAFSLLVTSKIPCCLNSYGTSSRINSRSPLNIPFFVTWVFYQESSQWYSTVAQILVSPILQNISITNHDHSAMNLTSRMEKPIIVSFTFLWSCNLRATSRVLRWSKRCLTSPTINNNLIRYWTCLVGLTTSDFCDIRS